VLAPTPHDAHALPSPDEIVTAPSSRTMRRRLIGGGLCVLVVSTACRRSVPLSDAAYDAAAATTTEATLSRRIDDLASDSMLGRGPGQRGDTLTVAYLEREMRAIGLAPGGNDGYRQPVTRRRLHATGGATFRANGRIVPLDSTTVIVAATTAGEFTAHDAPLVFVGYGIIAPEHQWDDYGAIDLHGKVALILDGEPEVVSARRFGTLDAWHGAAADSTIGPLELPLRLEATVRADGDSFVSYNVVGTVPGSDPSRRDECVVYLGHWDGYGIGPAVNGDSIYNGALDDAAGVSEMLLVAEAVRALPRAPRRTMVFVASPPGLAEWMAT